MEERAKQQRKQRTKNGNCTSKMFSFRADEMTLYVLAKVSNKGRLINNLVKQWWRHERPSDLLDEHADPRENDIDYYEP